MATVLSFMRSRSLTVKPRRPPTAGIPALPAACPTARSCRRRRFAPAARYRVAPAPPAGAGSPLRWQRSSIFIASKSTVASSRPDFSSATASGTRVDPDQGNAAPGFLSASMAPSDMTSFADSMPSMRGTAASNCSRHAPRRFALVVGRPRGDDPRARRSRARRPGIRAAGPGSTRRPARPRGRRRRPCRRGDRAGAARSPARGGTSSEPT